MLTVGSLNLATTKTVEDGPSDSEWVEKQKRLIRELNSGLIVNAVEKRHKKPNKKEEKPSENISENKEIKETAIELNLTNKKGSESDADMVSNMIKRFFPFLVLFCLFVFIIYSLMSFLNMFTFLCLFLVFFAILGWKNSIPHYLNDAYNFNISLKTLVLIIIKLMKYFKYLFGQMSLEEDSQKVTIIENTPDTPIEPVSESIKLPFMKKDKKEKAEHLQKADLRIYDEICVQRGLMVVDLTTKTEIPQTTYNFKISTQIMGKGGLKSPVIAELDTDSQLSIISKEYFDKSLSNENIQYLPEDPISFKGIGSELTSELPPFILQYQIGGVLLSGRFIVSNKFNNSEILLGNDAFIKNKMSLVSVPDSESQDHDSVGKWFLSIGHKPEGKVPVAVTRKIEIVPTVSLTSLEDDQLLEELLEPGMSTKSVDMETELDFIRTHISIPEKCKNKIVECLTKIPKLFSGQEFSDVSFPPEIYSHDIEFLDDVPKEMYSKPFPVSGIRLQQLKETIQDLVTNNVLKSGDSEYVSPCFFVTKKQNDTETAQRGRLCFDYRKLNSLVKPLNFPLMSTKNFFQESAKFSIFCVVDIKNAFLSIPLTERAKKRAAIITPFGIFLPQRTPFGLKSSPSAFCKAMSIVLSDLNFLSIYMDDILIGATNEEEMADHLILVFNRLALYNLKIQLTKSKFYKTEVKILGVVFSKKGRTIDPAKIQAIQKFPKITTLKSCQAFLGMLAFLSSFIPHYSTALYPVFNLLKDQKDKGKSFVVTKEAENVIEAIKRHLAAETVIYNPDFSQPLYLSTDASNVGMGSFLYQVEVYEKTAENEALLLAKMGYLPETGLGYHMLPGVSPGRQVPVVTTFTRDPDDVDKFNPEKTINSSLTMTEKISQFENKIVIVKPISWYSKTFSSEQCKKYCSMEKEFLSMILSLQHFRDYIEAAPICYVLTDSQPTLWALRHKEECVKLSRYLLKLWEFNINLVFTHIEGSKNGVADWLSRFVLVEEGLTKPSKPKPDFTYKSAQHIHPTFPPLSVVTKDQVLAAFRDGIVTKCDKPDLCYLNVNNPMYRGIGPFIYSESCEVPEVKRVNATMEKLTFSPQSLMECLTDENIFLEQQKDEKITHMIEIYKTNNTVSKLYTVEKNILYRKISNPMERNVVVMPQSLVPFALAYFHYKSHSGVQKLYELMRLNYYWPNMRNSISEFVGGCILCASCKSTNIGPSGIGVPRLVKGPRKAWQIDIVQGLPKVQGCNSFLNCVDMFTGFTLPIALVSETSEHIAHCLESVVFKCFGTPETISSDNAANLAGLPVRKLFKFYHIIHQKTTPYSPQSHGLVEVQNKNLTTLLRIFIDQFETSWLDVLTLAALTVNSIPRPVLEGHSPYFLMFNEEPFQTPMITSDVLDLTEHTKSAENNQAFSRLLREYLLKSRIQRNKVLEKPFRDYPTDTLIYEKDFTQLPNKKVKPIFKRTPLKVIKQYFNVLYASDLYGRVKKLSKNNIKIAKDRTVEMFSNLPLDIQAKLGSPLTLQEWDIIKSTENVPAYLESVELDFEDPRMTRGQIPVDTVALPYDAEGEPVEKDDDDYFDIWLNDDLFIDKLKTLHYSGSLKHDTKLGNVATLPVPMSVPDDQNDLTLIPETPTLDPMVPLPVPRGLLDMDPSNILPTRTRTRVQFDV
jgi:hypothetical protein